LFDYLQYLAGSLSVRAALKNVEGGYHFDKRWISYQARFYCYIIKQLFVVSGSVALIAYMFQYK